MKLVSDKGLLENLYMLSSIPPFSTCFFVLYLVPCYLQTLSEVRTEGEYFTIHESLSERNMLNILSNWSFLSPNSTCLIFEVGFK